MEHQGQNPQREKGNQRRGERTGTPTYPPRGDEADSQRQHEPTRRRQQGRQTEPPYGGESDDADPGRRPSLERTKQPEETNGNF